MIEFVAGMQATGSRALKALASRIHNHAVPLSNKESQQLLSLLSQSFDRHLDRYHPVHGKQAEHEPTAGVKAARHRSIDPNHVYSSHDTKSSSALSSAEHILKILDHPLLSRRANHKATSNESTITREEALPWLENKFADASASLNDIFLCLRALCGSPASKLHEADILFLRDQQASRKIEAWLFPEDVATVETLYATSHISPIWVKLLVLEGRQDTVRAKLLSNVTSAENKAVSIGLLVSFIRIVLENGAGIEAAVREVLLLKTHPHISRAINQILFHIPKMGQAIPIPTYDQLLSLTRGSRSETLASAVLTKASSLRAAACVLYNHLPPSEGFCLLFRTLRRGVAPSAKYPVSRCGAAPRIPTRT